MLIVCPSCKAKFSFDETKVGAEGIKLRCSKCRAIFKVARKSPARSAAAVPASPPPVAGSGIKVFIANESAAFCAAVKKVLEPEPFFVLTFNDGRETFEAVERMRPDVVLLDVALPSMYGFEVCERIRQDPALAAVKIILIAAIYDKTRYKRSPISLYGADDYIEKHHIPDSLTAMIYRLVADQKPVEAVKGEAVVAEEGQAAPEHLSSSEIAAQEVTRQAILQDEERETTPQLVPAAPQQLPEAHVKAKRLARIIVSDIILYNQHKVEDGVRNGTFYSLLQDDIREGTSLYERRVSEEIRGCSSYLNDAFEELIAKKKQELGL